MYVFRWLKSKAGAKCSNSNFEYSVVFGSFWHLLSIPVKRSEQQNNIKQQTSGKNHSHDLQKKEYEEKIRTKWQENDRGIPWILFLFVSCVAYGLKTLEKSLHLNSFGLLLLILSYSTIEWLPKKTSAFEMRFFNGLAIFRVAAAYPRIPRSFLSLFSTFFCFRPAIGTNDFRRFEIKQLTLTLFARSLAHSQFMSFLFCFVFLSMMILWISAFPFVDFPSIFVAF